MLERNGQRESLGIQCDQTGLSLAGVPLLTWDGAQFEPRPPEELRKLLNSAYAVNLSWDDKIRCVGAVARALNQDDTVRAMIASVLLKLPVLDWDDAVRIAGAENAIAKFGFNPGELRDWHGRWTDGDGQDDPGDVMDVAYQGFYHDELVKNLAQYLREHGCTVLTEVPLTGINKATARADLIVQAPNQSLPIVIEVKTGLDPQYTDPQRSVYPLAAVGGHVTSSDPRVAEVGLVPGQLFPPLAVFTTYQRGPGAPLQTTPIIPEFEP